MSHDFIQNAVNALYQSNELMALKAELANLKAKADKSEADNARLKAQIDAKMEVGVPYADYERLYAENARLKAEVERLEANTTKLCTHGDTEIARLKAEVERLTSAGDCLVIHIEACYREKGYDPKDCDMIDNWDAAKGGQP